MVPVRYADQAAVLPPAYHLGAAALHLDYFLRRYQSNLDLFFSSDMHPGAGREDFEQGTSRALHNSFEQALPGVSEHTVG